MRTALEIAFWVAVGLIAWTQALYGACLWVIARLRVLRSARSRPAPPRSARLHPAPARAQSHPLPNTHEPAQAPPPGAQPPSVSLIVAAHDEESVIAAKVENVLQLDYPRSSLEVIVACDGCSDRTAAIARDAGADLVLELPRGGKVRAQDAAVAACRGELVAFSDANALWEPHALRRLLAAFDDPEVGYACGEVSFTNSPVDRQTTNQEGAYWRYEIALRALESTLCSITAGNGAIYATRRSDYIVVDAAMGHDLSFPFNMVKRGRRAVFVPEAVSYERMVPSIEGELARKRRMMAHTWAIVLRGGMLSFKGYPPAYAAMIISHRLLRYLTPFLHLIALACNLAAVALGAGPLYIATACAQGAVLLGAALGSSLRWRALLIARYYVLTSASLAAGLWDWLREGVSPSWEAAEGTR